MVRWKGAKIKFPSNNNLWLIARHQNNDFILRNILSETKIAKLKEMNVSYNNMDEVIIVPTLVI